MSTPRPKPRRPVCPALIVCDRIVVRPDEGKLDLFGAFDMLVVPALPIRC